MMSDNGSRVSPLADARSSNGGVRMLLIEDDAVDRMAFERFIGAQRLDYEYAMATSLAEAREQLAGDRFDVVITDYHLGDGTAAEVFDLALDLPIIVITGAGDEEIAVEAMRLGAYDYLIKDVDRRYLKMMPVTVENARRHHSLDRQARRLSQALRSLNDSIFITDLEDRIQFVNDTFRRTYGYEEAEILGRRSTELWVPGSDGPGEAATLSADGEKIDCVHRTKKGRELAVMVSRSPIFDERGEPVAVVSSARDISERKRWEDALRESEERYALAAAGANDGLWDWDLRRGEIYFSPRWKALLGYSKGEVGSSPEDWFGFVHPDDLELLEAQIEAHHQGRTPHFENEHRMRTREGEYRWVQTRGLAVRDAAGEIYRMVGSMRDITDRKRIEDELTHAALHDSLTGLPNRALFMDRLANAVNRSKRRGEYPFGVIFLDLDRFKVVNDGLGHLAGDQLLRMIARRLESCVRIGDTVARLGGDEFAILLEDLDDVEQVERVAERIDQELRAPFNLGGQEIFSSASLGIALGGPGYERPEEILRDADTAMYRAKSMGRTRRVVFDPDMHRRALALLHLETDLRRAVDRHEFTIHYQPIVSLRDGRLKGFEALVRWNHPERGLLLPGDFLPVAQETGVTVPMGHWVLREACSQLHAWQKRFPDAAQLVVSVNLDGKQLSDGELLENIEESLVVTGLSPKSLQIEITEDTIIQNTELATSVLARLREQGIRLHIDDFGTGYSSLSQLQRFPIDTLKVDRSFVSRMSSDDESLEIVRTIVALAHNLHLEVMAEGVETIEQLAQLRALGCEFAQGFWFSKPAAATTVEEMLSREPWIFSGFTTERGPSSGAASAPS